MTWTPDRPTKPGKYWLSVHPDKRGILFEAGVYEVVLWAADQKVRHVGGLTIVPEDRLIGAQWLPCVEPPDPFAEPVPSLRERVEALPRLDPYPDNEHAWFASMKATPDGDYLDRFEVLALLDEVTRCQTRLRS